MRCDTQRDVHVIERFGGLNMAQEKKHHPTGEYRRGEYVMKNDFGSEKDMRRGRFAFPHLRDFYNQKKLNSTSNN